MLDDYKYLSQIILQQSENHSLELLKHGAIINEDEVIVSKQATPEYINDDDDLDDDSYPILNKEPRKQILIFERAYKVEQLFMDIVDLLDLVNEIINPESIK